MFSFGSKLKYIAGWEIDFNDPEQLKKILLTQGVTKASFDLFCNIQAGTILKIKNQQIIKTTRHCDGKDGESKEPNCALPVKEWRDRDLFFLHKDAAGTHSVGGPQPDSFMVPKCARMVSPFIYIATIDGKDPRFSWLKTDQLHISYPVLEGGFEIFLDYSDPQSPEVINPSVFDYSWVERGEDYPYEKMEYERQTYKAVSQIDVDDYQENDEDYLFCGVPMWYQYPQIPVCPKSGKVMQFVVTISSDKSLTVEDREGLEDLGFSEYLIFGDYGHLYVFYEPDSKVMFLTFQM